MDDEFSRSHVTSHTMYRHHKTLPSCVCKIWSVTDLTHPPLMEHVHTIICRAYIRSLVYYSSLRPYGSLCAQKKRPAWGIKQSSRPLHYCFFSLGGSRVLVCTNSLCGNNENKMEREREWTQCCSTLEKSAPVVVCTGSGTQQQSPDKSHRATVSQAAARQR